jgi:hypothetical protein
LLTLNAKSIWLLDALDHHGKIFPIPLFAGHDQMNITVTGMTQGVPHDVGLRHFLSDRFDKLRIFCYRYRHIHGQYPTIRMISYDHFSQSVPCPEDAVLFASAQSRSKFQTISYPADFLRHVEGFGQLSFGGAMKFDEQGWCHCEIQLFLFIHQRNGLRPQ